MDSSLIGPLQELGKNMPGGFFIYKADGSDEILYINDLVLEIFGCESEEELWELTGRKFTIYFPSIAECSRYIAEKYNKAIKEVQQMIKRCLPIGEFKISFPEWSD